MCHTIKTLAKNGMGKLSCCDTCQVFFLQFNNLFIEFTDKELATFQEYLTNMDVEYWECKNQCKVMKRRIPITTLQKNLVLMFNQQEFAALKDLVFRNTTKPDHTLSISEIDHLFILN